MASHVHVRGCSEQRTGRWRVMEGKRYVSFVPCMCIYFMSVPAHVSLPAAITPQLARDRYLSGHLAYLLRELRIVAYTQFLESYRSVTLQSMSDAFGVSTTFLDKELARFISVGRLNCSVDKVAGEAITHGMVW